MTRRQRLGHAVTWTVLAVILAFAFAAALNARARVQQAETAHADAGAR